MSNCTFWNDYVKADELANKANTVYLALIGMMAPRRAIQEAARLAFWLRPDTTVPLVHPLTISPLEHAAVAARDNKPFPWFDQEYSCAFIAAEELARLTCGEVLCTLSSKRSTIVIPDVPDVSFGEDDPEAWKAAYVDCVQACGLLDTLGEPTDAWPAFQDRYRRAMASAHWAEGGLKKLTMALRLEAITLGNARCPTKQTEATSVASSKGNAKKNNGKIVNERMATTIISDPTCINWSASEWATKLHCAEASVKEAATWRTIMTARKLQEAENATRSR